MSIPETLEIYAIPSKNVHAPLSFIAYQGGPRDNNVPLVLFIRADIHEAVVRELEIKKGLLITWKENLNQECAFHVETQQERDTAVRERDEALRENKNTWNAHERMFSEKVEVRSDIRCLRAELVQATKERDIARDAEKRASDKLSILTEPCVGCDGYGQVGMATLEGGDYRECEFCDGIGLQPKSQEELAQTKAQVARLKEEVERLREFAEWFLDYGPIGDTAEETQASEERARKALAPKPQNVEVINATVTCSHDISEETKDALGRMVKVAYDEAVAGRIVDGAQNIESEWQEVLVEVIRPFAEAANVWWEAHRNFEFVGETWAERQFSKEEAEKTADEAASLYLAQIDRQKYFEAIRALNDITDDAREADSRPLTSFSLEEKAQFIQTDEDERN